MKLDTDKRQTLAEKSQRWSSGAPTTASTAIINGRDTGREGGESQERVGAARERKHTHAHTPSHPQTQPADNGRKRWSIDRHARPPKIAEQRDTRKHELLN